MVVVGTAPPGAAARIATAIAAVVTTGLIRGIGLAPFVPVTRH
jgi:hypothetical protein